MGKKSAFVAIVGVPNVGKSSILNALLGQKISIVSAKPQTTRNRIMGILTASDVQLVFIDTPGIHTPKTQLGHYMEKSIKSSISSVDNCLFVVEAGKNLRPAELKLIEKLKKLEMPVVLLVNEKTASASELLVGAFKDFEKGKIVGEKTYGKAIGQAQISFDEDGSGLVITTACYYTPSGNCIQGEGIEPDEKVALDEEFDGTSVRDIPSDKDAQLKKAMEIVKAELK